MIFNCSRLRFNANAVRLFKAKFLPAGFHSIKIFATLEDFNANELIESQKKQPDLCLL